ncbi:DUF2500 domain-containing protein [Priestia aryabhattai]|uniref:DUF2500 domain-containing protein n=1 Tax=Priestia aryabhattai TaxID=412384 RepID=UPI00203DC1C3|nr:DUF2500 domain-containing protein [Priestia aryabhattai]MCM3770203.1 DUF2500 domain-containing protein [Priestia aryabhattai]
MFEDEIIFENNPSGDEIVFEGDAPDDLSGGAFFPDDALFNGMPTFVMLFFVIIIGIFLFSIFKGISTWSKNEQSPRLSVKAKITGKRTNVHRHNSHAHEHLHSHTSTTYYVTFEFESTDRSEFIISGSEYGRLAEGDEGMLTFQGTRFLDFQRRQNEEHADA